MINRLHNCAPDQSLIEKRQCSLKTEWLSAEEAAEYLRIPLKSLRNLTSNGKIPHYKLNRLNRYRKDELDKLLLSERRGAYGNKV